jgi:hypothetical protein
MTYNKDVSAHPGTFFVQAKNVSAGTLHTTEMLLCGCSWRNFNTTSQICSPGGARHANAWDHIPLLILQVQTTGAAMAPHEQKDSLQPHSAAAANCQSLEHCQQQQEVAA